MRNFDEIGVNIKRGIKGEKIKMRDKGIWEILAVLIVLVMIGSCAAMPSAGDVSESEVNSSSATIYVPDDYATIQVAVNAASPGDTIIVKDGTYKENVLLNKRLTLIGDALPTIDAQGKGDTFNITADYCVVTGFRCVNATKSRSAGIIVDSDWNRVENNTCENNIYGICLKDSSNNTISNNTVLNNKYGIHLYYPPSSTVRVNAPEYVEEGETFDVTIEVGYIEDLNSGKFDLSFDSSVVNVTGVADGSLDGTTIPAEMWIADEGIINVIVYIPGITGVSGSGYLAKISFKAKGEEGDRSVLDISNVQLVDDEAEFIELEKLIGAEIRIGKVKEGKEEEAVTLVGSHDNLISNNNILNNQYGIYLVSSSNNTLMNNTVSSNNRDGFYLKDSSNNTIKNNEIHENNDNGIHVYDSTNSMIASNEIYDNKDGGIYLQNSGNSTLTNNTMSGSDHNFVVYGEHLSDYIQTIDASNKVDGKPVYYWINKQDQQVPGDAGYVGVVNSTNITVKDLTLTNNGQGVLIAFSKDSRIENVNASDNKYGIYLDHSSNNVLMNNKVANNDDDGIYLEYSTNNEITENKISENRDNGICVHDSSNNNTIQNNEVRVNKDDGIYLKRSVDNEIKENKIRENKDDGIRLSDSSNNNMIVNNEISDNGRDGIDLDDSSNNIIASNRVYNNKDKGIYLRNSGNSTLTDNIISGNEHNFAVHGKLLSDYIQNIDASNKVEGKPVYYLVSKKNQRIPTDAGYVGVVNSTNITVRDLTLANNGQGVLIAFSKDSKIETVNVSNNKYGIYLDYSSNNVLINNKVANNDDDGIYVDYSSNNEIKNNEIHENKDNGICIYDSSNNNTIQDNEVRGNNDDGIYLKRSTNNEITNNKILENRDNGIYVYDSSNNNMIQNNKIHGNRENGIRVYDSTNSMITSNKIYANNDNGIYLRSSGNSTLTNNTISGSDHNFVVYGEHLSDYIQNIDASNKVDGKPVYYLINKQDQQIPTDAGYVGVVNSTNITVKDLALTNNGQGVLIAFSSSSKIENVNVSNNKYGIYLDYSSNNVLMNNKVSNNDDDGIYVDYSSSNEIKNNKIKENKDNGICIYDSSNNNTIQDNEVRGNNDDGIYLKRSTNNEIKNNKIYENRDNGICVYDSSNNNTIQNNEVCENNDDGIYLKRSTNNEIKNNEIHENRDNGVHAHDSSNSMITSNRINDNKDGGIYLQNSGNSTLTNNTISGNNHNFVVCGEHLSDYIQTIDASNKVDGKPVYYLINKQDQQIPTDAGYVGVVNSTNITVKDLALTNNGQGVLIAFSKDSRIENVNASNNKYGIYMDSSGNNTLTNNTIAKNSDGIYLELSDDNLIYNNYFDNRNNAYDSGNNFWNITKTNGTNIIGGQYLGGNYFSDYKGVDADSDGLGDIAYNIPGSSNRDYLPLIHTTQLYVNETGWWRADAEFNPSVTPIQDAIDNARNGDSIFVWNGTYRENVKVNKQLMLIGEGMDVVRVEARSPWTHIFEVTANYVYISGFTVTGAKTGLFRTAGIILSSDHCRISDNNVSGNYYGIYLKHSNNNTIMNNSMELNGLFVLHSYNNSVENNTVNGKPLVYLEGIADYFVTNAGQVIAVNCNNITVADQNLSYASVGIEFWSTDNSLIMNNTASNNDYGIYSHFSRNNTLANNTANLNNDFGILLSASHNSILTNNTMHGNDYNFGVSGNNLSHFIQSIDTSNLVDEKPVYYWVGQQNQQIPNDAGFVGVINSSNITVSDLTLTNNIAGVLLAYSKNSRIENVRTSNNYFGILLSASSSNVLTNNTNSNNYWGVNMYSSNNNFLTSNANLNNYFGIVLSASSNNTLTKNNVSNNGNGIFLLVSHNNTIFLNNFINNSDNVYSFFSTTVWNSTSKITYIHNETTYTNYLGNYWSDYNGTDTDKDGIGDIPYSINQDKDNYPLMERFENYFAPVENIVNTGTPANPPHVSQACTTGITHYGKGGDRIR